MNWQFPHWKILHICKWYLGVRPWYQLWFCEFLPCVIGQGQGRTAGKSQAFWRMGWYLSEALLSWTSFPRRSHLASLTELWFSLPVTGIGQRWGLVLHWMEQVPCFPCRCFRISGAGLDHLDTENLLKILDCKVQKGNFHCDLCIHWFCLAKIACISPFYYVKEGQF